MCAFIYAKKYRATPNTERSSVKLFFDRKQRVYRTENGEEHLPPLPKTSAVRLDTPTQLPAYQNLPSPAPGPRLLSRLIRHTTRRHLISKMASALAIR